MTTSRSKLRVLDLFSGIGGFSLGLERTGGLETVAFCEICPKARKVLSKHWPNIKQYEDIRGLNNEQLIDDGIEADVITGGFPCQDISCAGKGKGIKAERSGLWSEMFRLIRDVRPTWAIIENVSALRSKGLTLVLQNLSEIGMFVEWHCIPASAVGAPHQRDRIWIVANTNGSNSGVFTKSLAGTKETISERSEQFRSWAKIRSCGEDVADTISKSVANCESQGQHHWAIEPNVGRVAHGIPNRVDRLKQLGNSVVPQIPELIGNAILEVEG
jgi:DNA (cytosine-5)-methyltransferase 1